MTRARGWRAAVVAVVAAVTFATLLSVPASAEPMAGLCGHAGKVRPSPGLTGEAKDLTFQFRGTVGPCLMADGTTHSGTEFGSGEANGSCVARTARARWTIVWDTGRKSVIDATFVGAGIAINTSGPITKGEFAGGMFQDGHFLSGFDPTACFGDGVTEATYQGAFSITDG